MTISDNKYLGKLCPRAHDHDGTGKSVRYKSTQSCVACLRERDKTEQAKEYWRSDKAKAVKRAYQQTEKHRQYQREYDKKRASKRKQINRERWNSDPVFRLSKIISHNIRCSLSGNGKGGKRWENLVGYTVSDLEKHLTKTMPEGYSWDDFQNGLLHIDHIVPISAFNYSSPEHIDFKRCWALDNLRFLPVKENLSKWAKLDCDFQPCLAM